MLITPATMVTTRQCILSRPCWALGSLPWWLGWWWAFFPRFSVHGSEKSPLNVSPGFLTRYWQKFSRWHPTRPVCVRGMQSFPCEFIYFSLTARVQCYLSTSRTAPSTSQWAKWFCPLRRPPVVFPSPCPPCPRHSVCPRCPVCLLREQQLQEAQPLRAATPIPCLTYRSNWMALRQVAPWTRSVPQQAASSAACLAWSRMPPRLSRLAATRRKPPLQLPARRPGPAGQECRHYCRVRELRPQVRPTTLPLTAPFRSRRLRPLQGQQRLRRQRRLLRRRHPRPNRRPDRPRRSHRRWSYQTGSVWPIVWTMFSERSATPISQLSPPTPPTGPILTSPGSSCANYTRNWNAGEVLNSNSRSLRKRCIRKQRPCSSNLNLIIPILIINNHSINSTKLSILILIISKWPTTRLMQACNYSNNIEVTISNSSNSNSISKAEWDRRMLLHPTQAQVSQWGPLISSNNNLQVVTSRDKKWSMGVESTD